MIMLGSVLNRVDSRSRAERERGYFQMTERGGKKILSASANKRIFAPNFG